MYHQSPTLENAFEDFEFLGKADELNLQIVYISGYGMNVEYDIGHLGDFLENCEIVYSTLKRFEDIYKISTDEVSAWVKGKNMAEICKYLEGDEDPFSAEYAKLKRRWREFASILGQEGPEPEGFPDLKKKTKQLEVEFKESLGESGLKLLAFFRGEANFPGDLSKEDLVNILKKFQPFIMLLSGFRCLHDFAQAFSQTRKVPYFSRQSCSGFLHFYQSSSI